MKASVVIANYNNAKFINDCINSLKLQTYDNIEYKVPPTIDDPAILEEIKQDLIDNKILNNG